jgi:hypothetical protein
LCKRKIQQSQATNKFDQTYLPAAAFASGTAANGIKGGGLTNGKIGTDWAGTSLGITNTLKAVIFLPECTSQYRS